MKRRDLLRYLALTPLLPGQILSITPAEGKDTIMDDVDKFFKGKPKRIAAILTEYRPNSHADVIVGKYLEGYNQDGMAPYPRSKIVSMFTEQVPDTDMSRDMAKKHGVPIFRTVADALTLCGDKLAVDAVLLIGEHGVYRMNDKEQKQYPRFEMFLKITDVFRETKKSVPVFNDKHLSYSWRQAKRMVEISKELDFPMLAGSSVPVAWRIPAIDTPYGEAQKYAVGISYSGLDIYGFHLLDSLQSVVERRKGGETGVKAVQCLEGEDCWQFLDQNEWASRLFKEAISHSLTKVEGDMKELVKSPAVFVVDYKDGLKVAAFLLTGLVQDFTVAVELENTSKPYSTLMRLQGKPHHHFGCLVKNIEILFETGKPPYPVERTLLSSGILDFALESRILGHKKLKTPELAKVNYITPNASHFSSTGWDENGKRID
ncbi:hypothetical protein [Cyclobacterium amurskyense]|uniref:Uncharacterized protein n=1 Tax=Cyclobacterium amurskyense TaxID=320787 RepID=A0A0H4PZ69_9BACT|nr:hypothetical protein [Cyclobacterium amurskyense]AKP53722.1 hypothetical protein CA2015_4379 [Cyclobacterium amurskyense]